MVSTKTQDALEEMGICIPADKFARPQQHLDERTVDDLAAAIQMAVTNPIDLPPLAQCVFPGDTVSIVLQADLPEPQIVLQTLLEQVLAAGIADQDVAVVVDPRMAAATGIGVNGNRQVIASAAWPRVKFQIHHAEDQTEVAYLAAAASGEAIYVNRTLVDADMVLPVGSPTPSTKRSPSLAGSDCIYPDFSSAETVRRFRAGAMSPTAKQLETQAANINLGAFFAVQLVLGPGGQILEVLAGDREKVLARAQQATNAIWTVHHQGEKQTVLVTIESIQQTWEDFCRALIVADLISDSDGPLIIWSELDTKCSRQIRRALQSPFETGGWQPTNGGGYHASLYRRVSAIVSQRQVFLKSRLAEDYVEDLGLGFVRSPQQINHIIEHQSSGVFLRGANRCLVKPPG